MNLKNRLKISFFIIIALPIFLAFMMGKTILTRQLNSIQKTYDIEVDTIQAITNPIQILNRITRDVFNRIKLYAMTTPYLLEDEFFLDTLNRQLKDKYSFLITKKGEEIVYVGDEEKFLAIQDNIYLCGSYNTEVDGGVYMGGKNPFLVKQQEFICSDGTTAVVFVITDINNVVPQIKEFAIQAVISFILIIMITAIILVLWLYRSIIRPMNILKRATKEMKEGNLDYSIRMQTFDEIGELCDDFEEMRIHLKELIEVKMQYETNSRELLSNISHDLKTPLTTIKGYAEGIIDGVADSPEKLDRYIRTIYTKANDMSALVDELSMFAKLDNNSLPYNFQIVEISEYFNDCIDDLSFELEVKNIALEYENQLKNSCKVIVDREQLKRAVHNIIGNSEKYMDKEKGRVCVRIIEESEFVRVEIEDNGAGISKRDLPNIFERFFRADASRNTQKGGSGLGLAIVQKIIKEHGGVIWASSELGTGTTIYFTVMKWTEKMIQENKLPKMRKELNFNLKD
jgi:signal transduction histidine kinase